MFFIIYYIVNILVYKHSELMDTEHLQKKKQQKKSGRLSYRNNYVAVINSSNRFDR